MKKQAPVPECNGTPNVVCLACKRVIVLKCGCTFLRMCRCANPELPKEADNHERP